MAMKNPSSNDLRSSGTTVWVCLLLQLLSVLSVGSLGS